MFPCKVAGCDLSFRSEKDLLNHHIHSLEHEYCKLCKTAFEDDDALLKHKITSEKHIACPVCSEDFHTRAGLDRHVRQMHAAEQKIVCVGCTAVFSRAGGLIAHYEFNGCPVIARADFLKDVERKNVVTAVLKGKPLEEGYGYDAHQKDMDGGVRLPADIGGAGSNKSQASTTDNISAPLRDILLTPSHLPSSLDTRYWPALQDAKKQLDAKKENFSPLKHQSIASVSSNLTVLGDSKKESSPQKKSNISNYQLLTANANSNMWLPKQGQNTVLEGKEDYVPPHKRLPGHVDSSSWPTLSGSLKGKEVEFVQASERADNQSDAGISTHVISSVATQSTNTWEGSLATSTQSTWGHHPEQPATEWGVNKVEDMASGVDERAVLAEQINAIVMDPTTGISQWSKFWNPMLSKYECPLPDCRSKFPRLEALQTHLNSNTHLPEKFRCPACLRLFKGITALTQHTESQSNSCHIRKSTRLAEFVGQSTGNYLSVEGTHKDGSVKYTAGVPLPRSKYTI